MTDEQKKALRALQVDCHGMLDEVLAAFMNGKRDNAVFDAIYAAFRQRVNAADPEVRKAFDLWRVDQHETQEARFRELLHSLAGGTITSMRLS